MTTADLSCVAAIVGPHIEGTFKRDERINGAVQELVDHGLLAGGTPTASVPPVVAVTNLLQCRLSWRAAEQIATELHEAGLLAGQEWP